jgi:riboflavin synthase
MFTGLIECTGLIIAIRSGALEISSALPLNEISTGDSVAVNGACLTITSIRNNTLSFDISPETVMRTTFGMMQPGSKVNLERAMKLGGRLDGHLVTGHIDCIGELATVQYMDNAILLQFNLPKEQARMLVEKGSVAVDGISLTVNSVTDNGFSVSIIPHTLAKTTLSEIGTGKKVNIETDILGKYIARLIAPETVTGGLTLNKLMQNGFI